MATTCVNLVTGSVPRGADYFGRKAFVAQIWERLKTDNVLLIAPRRFGKTGAMYQLLDAPRAPFRPIYLDVEPLQSPADFIIDLLALLRQEDAFASLVNELWERTKHVGHYLRNLPSRIDLGGLKVYLREKTDVAKNWAEYGDRLLAMLARSNPCLLLLIDEFPIMVHHIAQANPDELEPLMRWFRAARLAPHTQTRFLIGGSINLESTLDSMGLVDTVNDFAILRLEAFDIPTAEAFVDEALAGQDIEISGDTRHRIVSVLGTPIPYLLSVLLTSLLDRHRLSAAPITVELVENVFERELLGGATPFFRHYYSRLQDYYPGDEARQAKALLGLLSRSESPIREDTLYQTYLRTTGGPPSLDAEEGYRRLMRKLENDFYVTTDGERWEFSNRAIKLWWKNNYGFQLS